MRLAFVLALLLSSISAVLGQGPAYIPGDVLVMLRPGASPDDVVADLRNVEGVATGLAVKREVSTPLRAWLLHFDPASVPQPVMLRAVRAHRAVQLAQNNHVIEQRNVPNDSQYGQQWHHQNINSEGAWTISTGGLTATGDTIVVCIIENADLPHTDLAENAWYNWGEVPDNGQDDDVNGYVDDFRGWNPATDNDNVYGGGHGTQVAGMIGATGNNSTGVSGANWAVKMMVVDYASTQEAAVVEAYTYPLVMRRLYNTTGGQKGAFVVATNASWGINGGQPADSPLWCAMYDSLGAQGVLSCGATANNNVNVDVVGDLPTACSSDFLVSVTATDVDDNRTFSAYGLTTIDVGAPGDEVFTTALGGGYGSTSGTSFASPLTAGVIGLLYSAPCASLMALVHNDPPAGALYIRQQLFAGVDQVGNLAGQTVTGGRINAGNSMQLIMNNCGTCPSAYNLTTGSTEIGSALLSWSSPVATTFDLRHRPVGATDWTVVQGLTATSYPLAGLEVCTPYEFQVRAVCEGEETDFGNSFVWTSEGCCNIPPALATGSITETTANISWGSVLAANTYALRHRVAGTTDWTLVEGLTQPLHTIEGLEPCTELEVQVSSICAQGAGEWSTSLFLTTVGCGACVDNTYCTSEGGDSSDEWIETVELAGITNTTGNDGGYGDHTGVSIPLTIGQAHALSLTPGFGFFPFNETWRVFIDLDHDGEFATEEVVFASASPSNATVSGQLTVPPTATPGLTRMRVVMKYSTPVSSACTGYDYGETEDYCVTLTEGNVGLEESSLSPQVRAFPSPADRDLFIDVTGPYAQGPLLVEVLDAAGRRVAVKAMMNGRVTITTADLKDGLYIFRITKGEELVGQGRFAVEHLW